MNHFFDVDDARQYGIYEAVMIANLQFWIAKNKANGKHEHEGRTWTYNSIAAFAELFPYMSGKQIRGALERLIEKGVLVKGEFNERPADRTLWYAFANETIFLPGQMELPRRANGVAPKGKSTNKTDINTDSKSVSRAEVIFDDWIAEVKAAGKMPIPEGHEVLTYAESIDLPREYVHLCWMEFKRTFVGNTKKKYIDWAKTFSNYVRKNYFGLWFEKEGAWLLTTAGKQLKKEMKGTA